MIRHFQRLGVTAVELMPVHQSCTTTRWPSGAHHYWGYNTIGFFAPHNGYASSAPAASRCRSSGRWSASTGGYRGHPRRRLQTTPPRATTWARRVVPRRRQRGLLPARPGRSRALLRHHRTATAQRRQHESLRLIMDSLRYWVTRCTATASASTSPPRWPASSSATGSPRSSTGEPGPDGREGQVIAEPWEVGGRLQVGGFPPLWTEWNGKYRDTVRASGVASRPASASSLALTGSSDLYEKDNRRPIGRSTS